MDVLSIFNPFMTRGAPIMLWSIIGAK